jgi:hypothetical protein
MPNSTEAGPDEGDDQLPHTFEYGHGRMPLFMKLAWLAFLIFGAWYLSTFLLAALGRELAAH